ncbi:Chaoptin [Gryllus bimaculatus]|nr:Chaoptin [Gryllus bimaculatus]
MQRSRQLRRRLQPTATEPPARAALAAALVAALCLAAVAAQDPTSSPASAPGDEANFTSRCICGEGASLNCSSLSLTHLTDEHNTCNSSVVTLDVSNNLLESIDGLEEWYEEELNASFNKIGEIYASSFHHNVEVVDVSWNHISKLDLENAHSLRQLNVSHNQLVRVESLPYLCNLQWLDLSHNLLEEIPDGLNECTELEMLNFSNNALHAFPVEALDFLRSEEDDRLANPVVDLRGNNLTSDDPTLLNFLTEINVTASEDDCSCAKLARGPSSFTLCVSAMCTDGTELWSSVNSTTPDTVPDTSRVGSARNETACEEDCEQNITSAAPTATDTSSTINSLTSTTDETLPSITDETSTASLPGAGDELPTTASSSVAEPTSSPTAEATSSSAAPLPPVTATARQPARDPGSARRGGVRRAHAPRPRPRPVPCPAEPATPAPRAATSGGGAAVRDAGATLVVWRRRRGAAALYGRLHAGAARMASVAARGRMRSSRRHPRSLASPTRLPALTPARAARRRASFLASPRRGRSARTSIVRALRDPPATTEQRTPLPGRSLCPSAQDLMIDVHHQGSSRPCADRDGRSRIPRRSFVRSAAKRLMSDVQSSGLFARLRRRGRSR